MLSLPTARRLPTSTPPTPYDSTDRPSPSSSHSPHRTGFAASISSPQPEEEAESADAHPDRGRYSFQLDVRVEAGDHRRFQRGSTEVESPRGPHTHYSQRAAVGAVSARVEDIEIAGLPERLEGYPDGDCGQAKSRRLPSNPSDERSRDECVAENELRTLSKENTANPIFGDWRISFTRPVLASSVQVLQKGLAFGWVSNQVSPPEVVLGTQTAPKPLAAFSPTQSVASQVTSRARCLALAAVSNPTVAASATPSDNDRPCLCEANQLARRASVLGPPRQSGYQLQDDVRDCQRSLERARRALLRERENLRKRAARIDQKAEPRPR
ncbi:hypothetical protein DFJ73DRAFT_808356 [Zopfochytrium polystomum]|nr:hypothetical protein DFJ73DRAFT_808356 [Zopfochytrium polystomum]